MDVVQTMIDLTKNGSDEFTSEEAALTRLATQSIHQREGCAHIFGVKHTWYRVESKKN